MTAGRTSGPIVLVGFMGAGKSTVGRLLADRLDCGFVDVDAEIERRTGRSIPSFFTAGEESRFRALEREVVAELAGRDGALVVSTGGGWAADPDRVRALPKEVLSVWLRVSPEVAVARASSEGASRPLLAVEDPLAAARALLGERRAGYAAADLTIETDGRQPGQIVDDILDRLIT